MEKRGLIRSAARILKFKFEKGLFENPYRVMDEALLSSRAPNGSRTALQSTPTKTCALRVLRKKSSWLKSCRRSPLYW